jgi:hypothetical protein
MWLLPFSTFPESPYTVKKFDEVARHPHLVTQDQFSLVSKKDFGIPEDNFSKTIEVFRQTSTNSSTMVECLKTDAPSSDKHSTALPLRHTYLITY